MNSRSRIDSPPPSFDQVAEDFLARHRRGEKPEIHEYQSRYPQWADEIAELFPTLVTLERHQSSESIARLRPGPISLPPKLGDYRIVREIGRGGMGIVYEAFNDKLKRRVALKILPEALQTPDRLRRFIREAQAAGQLHHSNIVPVFEIGQAEGVHYYAMQFINGENLDRVLNELRRFAQGEMPAPEKDATTDGGTSTVAYALWRQTEGSLGSRVSLVKTSPERQADAPLANSETVTEANTRRPLGEVDHATVAPGSSSWSRIGRSTDNFYHRVAHVGSQIADALEYAHARGVIHRDIKPSNLLLDVEGIVWLTDFGLADDGTDTLTQVGDIVGTLRYLAPERLEGEADARSDIYSLGLTLYELCTLQHPFAQIEPARLMQQIGTRSPPPPRSIRREVPRDLETIIVKAIARDPRSRYASAHELASDLRRFLTDRPVKARRVPFTEQIYRWARRNPTRAGLVGSLILIACLVTGGALGWARLSEQHAGELRVENARVVAQKVKADQALDQARQAQLLSNRRLYQTYMQMAHARTASSNPDQRVGSLRSIQLANELIPQLGYEPAELETRRALMRADAIAAMVRWDLEYAWSWMVRDGWTSKVAVDHTHHRLAQADRQGNFAIRSFDESLLGTLPTPGEEAWLPMFSPDGKYLAALHHHPVTGANPVVVVWQVDERRQVLRFEQATWQTRYCFSADSSKLAIWRDDQHLEVWDLPSAERVARFPFKVCPPHLIFARNDQQLIIPDNETKEIGFWRWQGEPTMETRVPVEDVVSALAWNESLEQLAAGIEAGILVWPPQGLEQTPQRLSGHRAKVVRVHLHPGGRALLSGSWDGTTRLYDLATGDQMLSTEGWDLTMVGFDPTGDYISFTGHDDAFGIWRLHWDGPLSRLTTLNNGASRHKARFVPANSQWVAYPTEQGVEVWNHVTRRVLGVIPSGATEGIWWHPDRPELITSGRAGLLRWQLEFKSEPGRSEARMQVKNKQVIAAGSFGRLHVNAHGEIAVAAGRPDFLTVADLRNGDVREFGPHPHVSHGVLTGDGRYLVSATWQGAGIKVWNLETQQCEHDLAPNFSTAALGMDSIEETCWIVSTEQIGVWSAADWTSQRLTQRAVRDGWAGDVAISPRGDLAILPYSRYVPQLVDAHSGALIAKLSATPRCSIGGVDWSQDGRYVSIAEEETILIWDLVDLQHRLGELGLAWEKP